MNSNKLGSHPTAGMAATERKPATAGKATTSLTKYR